MKEIKGSIRRNEDGSYFREDETGDGNFGFCNEPDGKHCPHVYAGVTPDAIYLMCGAGECIHNMPICLVCGSLIYEYDILFGDASERRCVDCSRMPHVVECSMQWGRECPFDVCPNHCNDWFIITTA